MTHRTPLIAGNWKLHKGPQETTTFAAELLPKLSNLEGVDVLVFPPAISLQAACDAFRSTVVQVGCQWTSAHTRGAYTGTNSAEMAREVGCSWALAGHSEVRRDLNGTDERINHSLSTAFGSGLLGMLAIGESLEERNAGQLEAVLTTQLTKGLAGLTPDQIVSGAIAYEPLWAIGTGVTATPEQAQAAHHFIRGFLAQHYPPYVAEQTRILYGGSVKPTNAKELLAHPDVDGALIGGAALNADSFATIAHIAQG